MARMAAEYLKERYQKPGNAFVGVVSRLDRLVSGVLILARTSKGARRLSEQIRERRVEKRYVAVVTGKFPEETIAPYSGPDGDGWVELVDYLTKDESQRRMRTVPATSSVGQRAVLRVRRLATVHAASLVEVELETGRKHQIRVQLAHHGHPIAGDAKYRSPAAFPFGIALHCYLSVIAHPTLGTRLAFAAPPPAYWRGLPAEFTRALQALIEASDAT